MRRKILLVEPNYKNKYPPMNLMKLATYHKMLGDEVTFFKGDLKRFILDEIVQEMIKRLYIDDSSVEWIEHRECLVGYLKKGLIKNLKYLEGLTASAGAIEDIKYFRVYFAKKLFLQCPKWDRICIATLFTFYWKQTIDTINFFKPLCKDVNEVRVGGIAASVVPEEMKRETGIEPMVGLLDKGGELDDNQIIIDRLPLDYSILEEIDYVYPEHDGYYGYMTRGCVNKCSFCAVPRIEPNYCGYIPIAWQIDAVNSKFGAKRNLLLLDNNVLASADFDRIVDEIKASGFDKKTQFIAPNQYVCSMQGLRGGLNDRGYIRSIVKQYHQLLSVQKDAAVADDMRRRLKRHKLVDEYTAKKEEILALDAYFSPFFAKTHKPKAKARYVDFNQGVDARILSNSPEKVKKLAELPIRPLRIAFDDWKIRHLYERAVRLAAEAGIRDMSNYLLYNYKDEPVDLYRRLKLNVALCGELGISIYSFPMRYQPVDDPQYFKNRCYTGDHWNRKFIRAIQAVLNSTKGKIGHGKSFFEKAFGADEDEFWKLLYMPEAMIVYRLHFEANGIVDAWWKTFSSLSPEQLAVSKSIIEANVFSDIAALSDDPAVLRLLHYYTIRKEDDI